MTGDPRSDELARNLQAVRTRIGQACAAAGRDPATLIVVTKFFGADDVARLARLGVTDVGENRDQEAAGKHAQCAGLPLMWHFIGQLQSNKARSVVHYADLVHTVDRPKLVRALDRAATEAQKVQDVASAYFLAQRVKLSEASANRASYVEKLELLHQIIVHAMSCKQTADPANAAKLHQAIHAFQALYQGK